MINILVIDGQGGGIGKTLIEMIRKSFPELYVGGVGTNSLATIAMKKAGASFVATGENAAIINAKNADVVMGVLGICLANSMHGEITPNIAEAVSSSRAKKILIPSFKCNAIVVGLKDIALGQLIEESIDELRKHIATL